MYYVSRSFKLVVTVPLATAPVQGTVDVFQLSITWVVRALEAVRRALAAALHHGAG